LIYFWRNQTDPRKKEVKCRGNNGRASLSLTACKWVDKGAHRTYLIGTIIHLYINASSKISPQVILKYLFMFNHSSLLHPLCNNSSRSAASKTKLAIEMMTAPTVLLGQR
jgi:hypothetical protein